MARVGSSVKKGTNHCSAAKGRNAMDLVENGLDQIEEEFKEQGDDYVMSSRSFNSESNKKQEEENKKEQSFISKSIINPLSSYDEKSENPFLKEKLQSNSNIEFYKRSDTPNFV